MSSIEVLDTGLIYRNPMPHLRHGQKSFPSLVALSDGELIRAMDISESMSALDRRSYVCRSSDGDGTWSEPV